MGVVVITVKKISSLGNIGHAKYVVLLFVISVEEK
jgi:hypothetical protein